MKVVSLLKKKKKKKKVALSNFDTRLCAYIPSDRLLPLLPKQLPGENDVKIEAESNL